MQITRGVLKKPLRVVVYGPEGIGKTTFASKFPNPVFIDTENSTDFLDVARFPKPSSWTMLMEEVKEAKTLAGQFQTLVIDTADWAEALCKAHIIKKGNVSSIEDFGYGKGYTYVVEEWGKLLNLLSEVRDAGLSVVLTAHAYLRKFEQPDEMGSYDRWALKLIDTPKCSDAAMTKEWADMILFANYATVIVKENSKDKKGKAQGGKRVMYTSHHPCWDAKNRQNLPDKLDFNFDMIAHCFPHNVINEAPTPAAAEVSKQPANPVNTTTQAQSALMEGLTDPADDLPFTMDDPPTAAGTAATQKKTSDGIPNALADLMNHSHITEDEVRDVIAQKGYYPADTTWAVMVQDGFVDGWIIPFWNNIVEMIENTPGRLPF